MSSYYDSNGNRLPDLISDTEPESSMPDLVSDHECWACIEGLENQMAHYGGCLKDPYDDYSYSNISISSNEEYNSTNRIIKEISTKINDGLLNGHFLAGKIPNSKYVEYYTDMAYSTFGMNLKPGDWVYTPYQLPEYLENSWTSVFSWEGIYKIPKEHVYWIQNRKPEDIRFGLPIGEYFIPPKNNQFYSHPALYDPTTGKTIKASKEHRKKLRKSYEINQLRIKLLGDSFIGFSDYKYQ